MDTAVIRCQMSHDVACELRRNLLALVTGAWLLAAWPVVATAQEHAAPAGQEHAAAPGDHGAAEGQHAGGEHGGLSALMWPTINFLILCGGLYYFLGTPFSEYLAGRSGQIRKDLTEAAEQNRTATEQLADVERKLQALPGEIAALKARGAQEIAAEEERIASAAAAERQRLLTQTKREIDVRLQNAQRELSDHAATLALGLASERLGRELTPADHARLVERYVEQVKER
jgi:F-type H+-transporting ATPase subunit b